jgi:hypothetical protein
MAFIRLLGAGMSALFCIGCASVVNDTNQPVKVETKAESGELVSGSECKLTNDYGGVAVKSGQVAMVHRSGKDLDITCTSSQNPEAVGRAISRANGGMWGNILLGGGIGAIVDHNKGTAYTYPTWVQLVFGKTLVFDRTNEKEGEPVPGKDPAIKDADTASSAAN